VWMKKKGGRSGRGDYLYSAALASDRTLACFGRMARASERAFDQLEIDIQSCPFTDQSEREKSLEDTCRNIKNLRTPTR